MKKIFAKFKNTPQKNFSSQNNLIVAEEESYYPNEITIKTIEEAERGENIFGPFNTVEEVMEALDAED